MLMVLDVAKGVKMALGKRKREQQEAWIATTDLPKSPGHVFYEKLNEVLAEAGFDKFVEQLCRPYYAEKMGRPGIPPGVYFRMVFAGYFEGIDSQRGIAWRCSDSLSMKAFLGLAPHEKSPDHSSMTNTRKRLPIEVFHEVFSFVLAMAEVHKLLKGKTLGVDSTMLEANAAMKTIVRKDGGDDWNEYLRKLYAEETGDENPTDDDLRRFDRKRKDKKVSNDEWESSSDQDARIARMKDGRTHLAYKAEHAVDLDTEIIVAAEVYHANRSDQDTIDASMGSAEDNLIRGEVDATPKEVVGDKGYYKTETLAELEFTQGYRTYIAEPKLSGRRNWKHRSEADQAAARNNRRRQKGDRGKALHRLRSERVERSFAHVCETGGARRCWLRGLGKVRKRYLTAVVAHNLGLILRKAFGLGKPRGAFGAAELLWLTRLATKWLPSLQIAFTNRLQAIRQRATATDFTIRKPEMASFSTGC
jgi:IS5 family transposase